MTYSRRLIITVLALGCASLAFAKDCPDPFADPKNDVCNPLRYIPSNALTGVAFAVFLIVALVQSWLTYKLGAKYMMAMVIGCYAFVFGFAFRFALASKPQSLGVYIGQHTLIVLSPCAFIAATYVLLGRLARYLDRSKYLPIRPTHIATIFVASDVVTFLIQAGGGGISASAGSDKEKADMGAKVFFSGLIVQLISFTLFMGVFYTYLYRIWAHEKAIWNVHSYRAWYMDWRALAAAQVISSIGILVRSIYRTVELSEGFGGELSTSEPLFYLLDTLPLLIAIAIYIPFWPGRFISSTPVSEKNSKFAMGVRQPPYEFSRVPHGDESARSLV